MLEHRRQQYLSLLGIENYMPTRILPSAAPSQLLPDELLIDPLALPLLPGSTPVVTVDVDEVVDGQVDNARTIEQAPVGNADTAIASPLDALAPKSIVADKPPEAREEEAIDDSVNEQTQSASGKLEPIKFVFSVWRVRDLLILDTRKVREALPTDRLLQNILRAVGYPTAQLPASESLRWPLFVDKRSKDANVVISDEQYNSDKEQARAMVQAYISAQDAKAPLKAVFLMGEDAATFTLDDSSNSKDCMGRMMTTTPWEGVQCFVMPSLYAMLQEPSSKRIAWDALQLMQVDNE